MHGLAVHRLVARSIFRFSWLIVFVTVSPIGANAITFNDGLVHDIDSKNSLPFEGVVVDDSPLGDATTLNVLPGAEIGTLTGSQLVVNGSSEVNVSGGRVSALVANGTSRVSVSGGQIPTMSARENSILFVSDGRGRLFSSGNSVVSVYGGEFPSTSTFEDVSMVEIFGGVFDRADGRGVATVSVFGGTFVEGIQAINSPVVNIFGGSVAGALFAGDTSHMLIYGSEFSLPFGNITSLSGSLTGVLSDGSMLSLDFSRDTTGTITLVQMVPEPTSSVLIVMSLLGVSVSRRVRIVRQMTLDVPR